MTKKRKKNTSQTPKRKRMKRKARLDSATHWISKYEGKNIIKGYRKHYGVDALCAIAELKILGVEIDPKRIEEIKQSEKNRVKQKQRVRQLKKKAELQERFEYSDETFAYIAGYTSGGAPYGVTWEELGEDPPDFDDLYNDIV